jgi:hypothetical protein
MPNQSQYRPAIRLSACGDIGCELVTERAINRIVLRAVALHAPSRISVCPIR